LELQTGCKEFQSIITNQVEDNSLDKIDHVYINNFNSFLFSIIIDASDQAEGSTGSNLNHTFILSVFILKDVRVDQVEIIFQELSEIETL